MAEQNNNIELSFGAKAMLMQIIPRQSSLTRREFLKRSLIVAGGLTFLSLSVPAAQPHADAADCSCYANCYTNCYSKCACYDWSF